MDYLFKYVQGHVEVYDEKGRFMFSADSQQEALDELRQSRSAA